MLMTVQYLSGAQLCNRSRHGCCWLSFFIFHAESCGNQISLSAEFCLNFSNDMSIKRLYSFISSLSKLPYFSKFCFNTILVRALGIL